MSDVSDSHKPTKVKVVQPYRVIHPNTGEAHTHGEVTVPKHLADEWARFGWVEHTAAAKEK
jgi:hypothetical protein